MLPSSYWITPAFRVPEEVRVGATWAMPSSCERSVSFFSVRGLFRLARTLTVNRLVPRPSMLLVT